MLLKFSIKVVIFITFIAIAVATLPLFNIERIKIDGFDVEILDLLMLTDTKYSDNYSHQAFNEVNVGMSEKDVIKLLGEPLYRWHPYEVTSIAEKKHFVAFQYSQSPSDTHYRYRQIQFDKGIVAEKNGYFYID